MGTVRKILLSHIMIAKVVLTLTLTNLVMAAPQLFSTPALPSPRINEGQVVSSVISTLQPAIAAAVAQALRGSSLGSSPGSSSRPSGGEGDLQLCGPYRGHHHSELYRRWAGLPGDQGKTRRSCHHQASASSCSRVRWCWIWS